MCCVDWASSQEDLRKELSTKIANGEYEGIEIKQFGWLWLRIPDQHKDQDDVLSQIRMYAIEAANLFDPQRGAQFSTFLTHHLRMRTRAWQEYLWQRSEKAKNVAMVTVSFRERMIGSAASRRYTDDGFRAKVAKSSAQRRNGIPNETSCSTPAVAENHAQLGEMLNKLSPAATEFLDLLLAYPDQDRLLSMLRSRRYRGWMRQHLSMTDDQITLLYEEVRDKLQTYL